MRLFAVLAIVCMLGCSHQQQFVEGSLTQIGLMIPYEGRLFGLQLVSHLDGVSIRAETNSVFSVSRYSTHTNSYFGIVQTRETHETEMSLTAKESN